MRLSQQQQRASRDSLEIFRKRRRSHPRACGCEAHIAAGAHACKKQRTITTLEDNQNHINTGRRRSLRIKESSINRGLSDVNDEPPSVKAEKEKKVKPESKAADEKSVKQQNGIESWDTRLRHRARDSSKPQIDKDIEQNQHTRKRKRERDLSDCNGPGHLIEKPDDSETETFALPCWATKSRRKPRLQAALGIGKDAIASPQFPDLHIQQWKKSSLLDLNANVRQQPTSLAAKDGNALCKDINGRSSSLDGKNHANKQSMLKTAGSDALQIDITVPCNAQIHLQLTLAGNSVQEQQHKSHSLVHRPENLKADFIGIETSEACMIDEEGIACENTNSNSECSRRDLGSEAKYQDSDCSRELGEEAGPQPSKGSSRGLDCKSKLADSENGNRDLGVPAKHQSPTAGSHPVCKSSNENGSGAETADTGKIERSGVYSGANIHVEEMDVDEATLEQSAMHPSVAHQGIALCNVVNGIVESGARLCEDNQSEDGNDIRESNSKHCKHAIVQQEADRETVNTRAFDVGESLEPVNESMQKGSSVLNFKFQRSAIIEGRKCGLCGVGNDGKPPKKLSQEITDSDNEICGELQATTEESKYQEGDGFGDDPGWLGRLLGPLNDRHGITGVWVHKQCAVWSPEVYFSGLGCLKNVRAALARGRALKCSRCDRPGATIGCRVDRCPRTYHLACGRAEGCVFDHKKYLMACTDHLYLFHPRVRSCREMQKMRLQKMVIETRKENAAALRKDLEAEEKWLENYGEDEEFSRRERKRLHRDLERIAPVYIGGSSSGNASFAEGWESVAGLQNVVRCMKEVVILPLLYPQYFDNLGITPPRGVLLHGYPGTGKTLAVRALVGACSRGDRQIAYFFRKGADCLGKYVGDAERQLRLLFQVAEQCQPSVIFFDEMDGLAPKRSRQQDQTHSSVVSTLLALMDGLKSRGSVVVIGATNCPEHLDPALRRPGRFDREIYFPLPSVEERAAILDLHTRKWPKPPSGEVLSRIAQQTPGYAGADLQALCTQAAIISLKRNLSLKDLFSFAEKKVELIHLPTLPRVTVKESDWAAALAQAPPPCSRRVSSMAVDDVSALPLQKHMVSTLLQPLVELLVSLYLDGRIALPPILWKACRLIQGIVTMDLQEKNHIIIPWWSSLKSLPVGSKVARDIENSLSSVGLICDGCESLSSDLVSISLDEEITQNIEDSCLKTAENNFKDMQKLNVWGNKGRGIGFRVLICGDPKSGQKYLASCILHGFEGYVEIRKLSLATMFQEGHGDLIQGLTHILGACRNIGSCVFFMPKIEVWALAKAEGDMDVDMASQAWDILVQQVDSLPADLPLIFLATCELPALTLPLKIRNFFMNKPGIVPSPALNKNAPRFYVQLPATFDCKLFIDQAAKNITRLAIRRYIEFIHDISHCYSTPICKAIPALCDGNMNERPQENVIECLSKEGTERENASVHEPNNCHNADTVNCFYKGSQDHSSSGKHCSSLLDVDTHHFTMNDGHEWQQQWSNHILHKASYHGSGKGRTALQLAIATCGYQLLCYPQFAELCWVTSMLKGGPCTTIDGPWKGWPFNSCILDTNSSLGETPAGDNCGELKDRVCASLVTGLVAVGLLAYKGLYKTGKEVANDVRKVLEVLLRNIKTKIQNGKDKYKFSHLLSQAASLEDMMNSWAYSIQSLEVNSCTSIGGMSHSKEENQDLTLRTSNGVTAVDAEKANSQTFADACPVSDANYKNVLPGDSSGPNVPPLPIPLMPGSSVPASRNICMEGLSSQGSFTKGVALPEDSLPVFPREAVVKHDVKEKILEKSISLNMPANGIILKDTFCDYSEIGTNESLTKPTSTNHCFHDSKNAGSQSHTGLGDIQGVNIESINKTDKSDILSRSQVQCVYHCCLECIHSVLLLVKQFLKNCWNAEGNRSSIDSAHDLVTSCTVNILAVVAQFCILGSRDEPGNRKSLAEVFGQLSCSCKDMTENQIKCIPSIGERHDSAEEIFRRGCKCHASLRKKNFEITRSDSGH
ncbi:hypothetical protein SUGI_0515190 [Cryptomeria japonica]|nr:hypothetical protein SUGI_0515190 [Cryptomeria japonica]